MSNATSFVPVAPKWWASNFGGMVVYGAVASRSRSRLLRLGFAAAVALHVGESIYAYRRARAAGFEDTAPRWALQTLGVGFPSLIALT
jgi:transmembrane protein TMEM254